MRERYLSTTGWFFLLVRPRMTVPAPLGILRAGPSRKTTKNEKSLSARTDPHPKTTKKGKGFSTPTPLVIDLGN